MRLVLVYNTKIAYLEDTIDGSNASEGRRINEQGGDESNLCAGVRGGFIKSKLPRQVHTVAYAPLRIAQFQPSL